MFLRLQVARHLLLPRRTINVLHGPIAATVVASSSTRTGKEEFGRSDGIRAEGKGGRVDKKALLIELWPEFRV